MTSESGAVGIDSPIMSRQYFRGLPDEELTRIDSYVGGVNAMRAARELRRRRAMLTAAKGERG